MEVEASTARPTEEVVSAWAGIGWLVGKGEREGERERVGRVKGGGREGKASSLFRRNSAAPERLAFERREFFDLLGKELVCGS